jgi:hypothetical protein
MSLIAAQSAFLLDVARLILFATSKGYNVTGGELSRTIEQQRIYVCAGKSKTMNSNHLRRLAIDLFFFLVGVQLGIEAMRELGAYWESLNPLNRWGGNFKTITDAPHFERNEP